MTARQLASLALALGFTLAGCSGDGGTDTKTDTTVTDAPGDDDDDSTGCLDTGHYGCDTGPTHSDPDWFDAYFVTWEAQFGYDNGTRTLQAVGTPYGDISPSLDVTLALESWQGAGFDPARTDLYCVISLPLTSSDFASWAQTAGYWYGVDYSGTTPESNCNTPGYELDPALWGTDAVGDIASYGAWGVAVGELTPDAEAIVSTAFADYLDIIFGGEMIIALLGGSEPNVYSLAYETTADLGLVINNDGTLNPLQVSTIYVGSNILTAWYTVNGLYLYSFSR